MARVIQNRQYRNILSAHHHHHHQHQRARLSRNRIRIRIGNMTTTILDDSPPPPPFALTCFCGLHAYQEPTYSIHLKD